MADACRRQVLIRVAVVILFIISLSAQTWQGVIYSLSKQVTIVDNGNALSVPYEDGQTVDDILRLAGIKLGMGDTVDPPLDTPVSDGCSVVISRAMFVVINNGNQKMFSMVGPMSVSGLLKDHDIPVDDTVKLNVSPTAGVTDDMEIDITYTRSNDIIVTEVIPFETREVSDDTIFIGESRIIQQGAEGELCNVYRLYYENDRLVSRTFERSYVNVEPVEQLVGIGTKPEPTPTPTPTPKPTATPKPTPKPTPKSLPESELMSRGGSEFRYSTVLDMTAYAYTAGVESTGKNPGDPGYGITASGMSAQRGVVAVDPSVIRLGSRLYIESYDGSWSYGYAIAADTGKNIKGNKIDLFMDTRDEAIQFGKRSCRVYILDE